MYVPKTNLQSCCLNGGWNWKRWSFWKRIYERTWYLLPWIGDWAEKHWPQHGTGHGGQPWKFWHSDHALYQLQGELCDNKYHVLWYFDSLRWMVTMWRLSWTLVLKQQLCPRYHISLQSHRLGGDPFVSCQAAAERCGIMRLVDTRWAGIAKGVGTQKILGIGICVVFLICINIETNIVFLVWKFHFDLLRNIFLQGGFTWPRSR